MRKGGAGVMKKIGDLTLTELSELCYSNRYCQDCEIYSWCKVNLDEAPAKLKIKNVLDYTIGPITAEEIKDVSSAK